MSSTAVPSAFWSPRRVAWCGGLLIAALVGQAAYDIWSSYRRTVGSAERALDSQSRVIAEQTARTVQAVDVMLRYLVQQFEKGPLAALSGADLHQYLVEQAVGLVQSDGLAVIGADGRLRAASHVPAQLAPTIDLNGTQPFEHLRSTVPRELTVGVSLISPANGNWVVPMGRALRTSSGGFAGVAASSARVDYFQRFYRDVFPEPGLRIALLHRDTSLLARHPPANEALGRKIPLVSDLLAAAAAGEIVKRHASPLDGVDRFGATREVPGYPLVVVVTRDAGSVLAGWRNQAIASATRTLILAALGGLLIAVVMRQFARVAGARSSLSVSEQRYALAAAGSDVGIWDWDLVAGTAYESRRARELQGLPLEPETQPLAELQAALNCHPEDAPRRAAALQAHIDGDTPHYEVEYRVRRADGHYAWIHVRALCIRGADGKALRIAGSVSDIDARKRAEVALHESEERFVAAVDGSDDGVWLFDYAKGTAFSSPRSQEIIGAPPGPPVMSLEEGMAILTRQLHPEDLPRRNRALEDHLAGLVPAYVGDFRVRRADGGWRWVHIHGRCVFDAQGRPLRIAGSSSDIDDRKHAEAALRESEERYALAMTGSNEGHWLYDIVAGQIYVSAKLAELFGFDGGAQTMAAERYFASMPLHPEDAERVHHNRNQHIAGLTPRLDHEFRVLVPRADGQPGTELRWMHTRAQCFRDEQGRPLRLAGSTVDATPRKVAEEALRESEARFAVSVAGSGEGLWVWNFTTGEGFASQRCREIAGLGPGPEQQPIETWFAQTRERVHPDDLERWNAELESHLAGQTPAADGEFRVNRNGDWRWVRLRGVCERDPSGRPLRMAGSVSDIDARRRAEEGLRQSERRFAAAVAGSDDGIWEWDYSSGMAFTSARSRELIGLPPTPETQPLQAWFAELSACLHPEDRAKREAAIADHLAGRSPAYAADLRAADGQGGWRWVRVHGRCERDASGQPLRMAGSVSDIDARKRAEEALRQSEERYALAMAGSNGGHWVWDTQTDSFFVSEKVNELFGLPADHQATTRSAFVAQAPLHADDREPLAALVADMVAGRVERADYEVRVVLPEAAGGERWILSRAQRFADPDGRNVRIAGVSVDIGERKRAEAERQRLEEQLRQAQKLEAIGTLAGGIAHDFNNILSAILGYGELAQKGAAAGSAQRRHIDAAIAAGQRAKSLVERILAFSRSGMGERVPVHVQSVVDEALDAVAASLPRGVLLQRRLEAGDAGVVGDPTQIHQVVMNLCANAVQAMRSDGRLDVSLLAVALDAPLVVTTSTLPAGNYLRLDVVDTGAGIAPAVVERIFDPFFTTKEVGVGTGLGLSLVHGIVTDLGGGIAVESRVGAGTRLTVWLPSRGVVAASAAAPAGPAQQGSGQTVLLVDDEEALVRLAEETLAELGYEPVGFTSAEAALAALQAEPGRFDLLLSDEAMPGLTGSELALEARALVPDLPIVLMSGYVSPALLQRAQAAGVAEVLSKPLAAADIARALALALAGGAAVPVA